MKNFKTAFLGIVFLCGLTAMSSNNPKDKAVSEAAVKEKEKPCSTAYTECDERYPEDYAYFAACMIENGCG